MKTRGKDAFDPLKAAQRKHESDEIVMRTAPLPDFMVDPSVLPKRPPSRSPAPPARRRREERAS